MILDLTPVEKASLKIQRIQLIVSIISLSVITLSVYTSLSDKYKGE